jgi:4-hydroxybenzoate polyprenyltransferase
MKELWAYLRLFRWANLLIMAATQVLFRYAVILPSLNARGMSSNLGHFDFFLLVISTLFISAAAYAINDYFDLRIDRINKPHRIVLGKSLSRRHAILWHVILNSLGVIMGIYLSWRVRYMPLAIIFIFIPALLWLYSIYYKRKFLLGNLLVAFLAAFVVAVVWIVEYRALVLLSQVGNLMQEPGVYARIFGFFAFYTTLIREIIKDVEDVKGDVKAGCRTVPVVLGVSATRRLLLVMLTLLLIFIAYAQIILSQIDFYLVVGYLLLMVQLPLMGLIFQAFKASSQEEFRKMQHMLKFIMVTGVLSMLILMLYI